LTPGAAGPNHYRLTVAGDARSPDTEALLRLTFAGDDIGQKEIKLDRSGAASWEHHGSELGIAGDWDLQVIVREIGRFEWTASTAVTVEPAASSERPRPPWRFNGGGIAGLALVAVGLAGLVVAWRAGKTRLRTEGAGLGVVAIALGALLLTQSRVQPVSGDIDDGMTSPVAATTDSITRGSQTYQANCLACHGTGGKGDGPGAAGLNPPPADFTDAHARAHADSEFYGWIRDGKSGTAMPAFGDELDDDEIWDVINYIRAEFQNASATPSPVEDGE